MKNSQVGPVLRHLLQAACEAEEIFTLDELEEFALKQKQFMTVGRVLPDGEAPSHNQASLQITLKPL